ncbi:MAG: LamG domain-containing protein, partial [Gemmatimonadetes bacterium]|nr:LamG domain-containing protein [Gemmatimonadota bacterium]
MISRVVLMMTALSLLITHRGVTAAQLPTVDRSNLVLELLFDGDARDTSGNGLHGEVFGPVSADDRFGQPNAAFAFDGKDDYIRVAPPPALSSEAFTLSVWVKFDDDAFSRYWTNGVITQDNAGTRERRVIQLSTFGPMTTWHKKPQGRDPLITRPVGTSVWRHLVATHDGKVHRFYMDGELHDQAEAPFPPHPQEPVYVGRKGSGEADFYFKGVIDDVRIYTETLSPEAILALTRENGWQPPALPGIEVPDPPESSIEDALVAHWPMDSAEMRDVSTSGLKTIVMGQPESIEGLKGRAQPDEGSDAWAVDK